MVKRIKLFGWTIWEIETIDDDPEDEEPMTDPYNLGVTTHLAGDTPPTFGFVTNWEWEDE